MKKKEYLKPDIEYVGFVYSVLASFSGGAGHETEPESFESGDENDISQVERIWA